MQARQVLNNPVAHFLNLAGIVVWSLNVDVELPLNLQGTSATGQVVHASPVLATPSAIELVAEYVYFTSRDMSQP